MNYLPVIDFRPFAIGKDILAQMNDGQNDKLLLTGNSIIPQNYNIELLNMSGQLIEKRSLQLNKDWQVEIPIQHFTPGLYFLSIASESGRKTKRLMID